MVITEKAEFAALEERLRVGEHVGDDLGAVKLALQEPVLAGAREVRANLKTILTYRVIVTIAEWAI